MLKKKEPIVIIKEHILVYIRRGMLAVIIVLQQIERCPMRTFFPGFLSYTKDQRFWSSKQRVFSRCHHLASSSTSFKLASYRTSFAFTVLSYVTPDCNQKRNTHTHTWQTRRCRLKHFFFSKIITPLIVTKKKKHTHGKQKDIG